MRYAEPPVDPPQVERWDCEECSGGGVILHTSNEESPQTVEVECDACYGRGRFDPDDNPHAPDTWKEAEGIA